MVKPDNHILITIIKCIAKSRNIHAYLTLWQLRSIVCRSKLECVVDVDFGVVLKETVL